jgi:hypothetical protein
MEPGLRGGERLPQRLELGRHLLGLAHPRAGAVELGLGPRQLLLERAELGAER